jgi:hypothetical protein
MQGIKFHLSKPELEELTSQYSDVELSKKFKVTTSTIFLLRKKHGIKSFSQKTSCRKSRKDGRILNPGEGVHHSHLENLKRDYFESIDSEFKAYFLGLLAADGHIADSGKGCFMSLELQKPDDHVIKALAQELNFPKDLEQLVRPNKKDSSRIRVYSRDLVSSLLDKGMTFNTESHQAYVDLSLSLRKHFIRGVVDGDGSIVPGKNFYIGSCSLDLLTTITSWIPHSLNLECKISCQKLKSEKTFYRLSITPGKTVVRWLYEDCQIAIPRKQDLAVIWFSRY